MRRTKQKKKEAISTHCFGRNNEENEAVFCCSYDANDDEKEENKNLFNASIHNWLFFVR